MSEQAYQNMWEDFGRQKAKILLEYKFVPTHRVGLTNYLREQQIIRDINPQLSDRVLDVGCAAGRQLFQMASRIREGVGVDIAQSFMDEAEKERARLGYTNLSFKQALVESLPFADASFDKVMCAEVIEHVFDKEPAIRELLRVLKPGGTLIISVPNFNADGTWWGRLLRRLGVRRFQSLEHFSAEEIVKHGDAHVREFSVKTLSDWIASRGVTVLNAKSVSFFDGPGMDFILKFPLHVSWARRFIIACEWWLTNRNIFWGRQLIVSGRKK